jgi:hypothetical protein
MSENVCPNINSCRMISTEEVVPDPREKETYMDIWCRDAGEKWRDCKRFSTKAALGFCPDFVVPDTALSIDEIIDKFEEQS